MVMSKKHLKKLKRAKKKKKDKKVSEEQQRHLAKQMNMFDRLPDSCSACKKEFPKTREAHTTWQGRGEDRKTASETFLPRVSEISQ